ncbi:MAG: glycosyltransferase [Planctomycetes bacterium]|nr:glycosyltransferase [Planctomycetota bacterium]
MKFHGSSGVSLSIIVPTFERTAALRRCLVAIRTCVRSNHEIVVVAGGDNVDEAASWVRQIPNARLIREEHREGLTSALNAGIRESLGRFVMWLHDDARPLPGAIDAALGAMKRPDLANAAMFAFYQTNLIPKPLRHDPVPYEGVTYSLGALRDCVYSSFALVRRESLNRVGLIDTRYYLRWWELDLAMRLRDAGMLVAADRSARIAHEVVSDHRRALDSHVAERDLQRLKQRWELMDAFSELEAAGVNVPFELISAERAAVQTLPTHGLARPGVSLRAVAQSGALATGMLSGGPRTSAPPRGAA